MITHKDLTTLDLGRKVRIKHSNNVNLIDKIGILHNYDKKYTYITHIAKGPLDPKGHDMGYCIASENLDFFTPQLMMLKCKKCKHYNRIINADHCGHYGDDIINVHQKCQENDKFTGEISEETKQKGKFFVVTDDDVEELDTLNDTCDYLQQYNLQEENIRVIYGIELEPSIRLRKVK